MSTTLTRRNMKFQERTLNCMSFLSYMAGKIHVSPFSEMNFEYFFYGNSYPHLKLHQWIPHSWGVRGVNMKNDWPTIK